MADLLIEFVSEEIPARMQPGAGPDLARLIESALTKLGVWHDDSVATGLCAPRHLLAYVTNITALQPDRITENAGRVLMHPRWRLPAF
jgi:glycyl-tRNA synthetase beta chain